MAKKKTVIKPGAVYHEEKTGVFLSIYRLWRRRDRSEHLVDYTVIPPPPFAQDHFTDHPDDVRNVIDNNGFVRVR